MGIFDIFTGDAAKKAAQQQRSYFDQTQQAGNAGVDQSLGQSLGYVQQGAGAARNDLTTGFTGATGAIGTGANNALGYLDQGNAGATGYLNNATAAYQPLSNLATKYGGATSLALDSYGANGAAGNQRATDAFHAGPGYNFSVDQGLEAINRRRNMGGMLDSGNADRDAQKFGQGLADQNYNQWQTGLSNFINPELSATSGAASGTAGVNTAGAGLSNQLGTAKAGVATGAGTSLSSLLSGQGAALGAVDTGQGSSLSNLTQGAQGQKLGLTQSVLQPYANTYGQEAAAQQQGSANLWGLGLNLAKLGTGFLPSSIFTQPGKAA